MTGINDTMDTHTSGRTCVDDMTTEIFTLTRDTRFGIFAMTCRLCDDLIGPHQPRAPTRGGRASFIPEAFATREAGACEGGVSIVIPGSFRTELLDSESADPPRRPRSSESHDFAIPRLRKEVVVAQSAR